MHNFELIGNVFWWNSYRDISKQFALKSSFFLFIFRRIRKIAVYSKQSLFLVFTEERFQSFQKIIGYSKHKFTSI